jgi:hypothetical protein
MTCVSGHFPLQSLSQFHLAVSFLVPVNSNDTSIMYVRTYAVLPSSTYSQ